MLEASRAGEVSGLGANWVLAPYWGFARHGVSPVCGGIGCWKHWRACAMYPGINTLIDIIPIKGKATVFGACPVLTDNV